MLVFVYGTLTDPDRADAILDDWRYFGAAVVDGLHRVDGTYPTLAPGGTVEGRLLRTTEVDRLDAYEGVDAGLYVRVSVPRAGGDVSVEGDASVEGDSSDDRDASELDGRSRVAVYVGDPARLDADATWPGEGSFAERVRAYLRDHDVRVRPSPDRQD